MKSSAMARQYHRSRHARCGRAGLCHPLGLSSRTFYHRNPRSLFGAITLWLGGTHG